MTNHEAERTWRALAETAIGGDIGRLASTSTDGVTIAPLYPRRATEGPRPWRAGPWSVAGRIDHPDPGEANHLALLDLEGGADALTLVIDDSPFARGFGISAKDIPRALEGIELDFIALRVDAGAGALATMERLATLIDERRLTSAGLRLDLGYDPIGLLASTGAEPDLDLRRLLDLAYEAGLAGRVLLADSRPYHEAGGGEAQELAALLATGVASLRRLEQAGLSLDDARDQIAFLSAMDADVFLGLAKTRALRRLWARVEAASGLDPKPIRLHAETSWRMMSRRDPWTNVMRATAATFAAGVGGADVLTVLPFTLPLGLPDAPARRLARNVQRVLIDEANLAMVDDPAAGSGGLEALTDELCDRAWTLFQTIEAEGGIESSLSAGAIQARIAAAARPRANATTTLTRGLVGTNRFPSLDAPVPTVLDVPPRPPLPSAAGALPSHRDAAPFEVLRDRADAAKARPTVFLATLGPPAAYGARATYAANFFAAGGLAVVAVATTRSFDETIAAFTTSGADVACLCGTDKAYVEHAVVMIRALRDSGAQRVLRAGRSTDDDADHGMVDGAIHDGCDALAILSDTLDVAIRA